MSEFKVRLNVSDYILTNSGDVRYNCPYCVFTKGTADTKYHLYVVPVGTYKNVNGNKLTNSYHCFRCKSKGRASDLFEGQIPHVSHIPVTKESILDTPKTTSFSMSERFVKCTKPLSLDAEDYLYSRGLTESDIEFYKIREGIGFYRNRVVIPTVMNSEVVYYVARKYAGVMDSNLCVCDASGCSLCKRYLNPKGSRSNILFNYDESLKHKTVIVTEGVFSSIAAGRNAVATFGSNVTQGQRILLLKGKWEAYYIALDHDAVEMGEELAEWLWKRGRRAFVVHQPSDPADVDDFSVYLDDSREFDIFYKIDS